VSAREAIETTATEITPVPQQGRYHGYSKTRELAPIVGAEWERMPGESDPSWEGFTLYKAMDPRERSMAAVARQMGKHENTILNQSKRYFWPMRAKAWDRYVAQNADAAAQEELVQQARAIREQQIAVVKRQLDSAKALEALILRGMAIQNKKKDAQGGPDARILDYLARALERVTAQKRLATGLPTDVTQQSISLKRQVDDTLRLVDEMRKIIDEELCPECIERVANRLERVLAQQRAVRARLD
jgi:hypothetical protein